MSLARGEEWIRCLLDDLSAAKISKKPNDKLELECAIFKKLICLRNDITEEEIRGDPFTEGHYFDVKSNFKLNEDKLSNMYKTIFAINKYGVSNNKVTALDDKLGDIIRNVNDKLPLWHQLKDADVTEAPTPLFKYKSKSQFRDDLLMRYAGADTKFEKYADIEKDRDIYVRNDNFPPTCKLKVKLTKQIQVRVKNETNPHYKSHPCEFMLIGILGIKTKDVKYFDYGLRFIELYMLSLMEGENDIMHLPIEFKTDGMYSGIQYETLFIQQFRYVINLLTLKMHNVQLGLLIDEHINVSNEILLHILRYPYLKGKEFKSAFTPVGLYYCMDANADKTRSGLYTHRHAYYHITRDILDAYPYSFSQHSICTGEKCLNNFKSGIYSNSVKEFISTFGKYVNEHTLKLTNQFVEKRLIPVRPNPGAGEDVIFMRLHIGAGGYSHTHKLADFIPEIEEHYENNEKFVNGEQVTHPDSLELIERLRKVGYTQTRNLINKGSYPTAEKFKTMLPSFLTSKSSGVAPIQLVMKLKVGKYNTEMITQNLTSKTANAALRGESVFNIPMNFGDNMTEVEDEDGTKIQFDLITPVEYYESLDAVEQERIRLKGLDITDLSRMNVSKIGSRATSGYRAIRAIFMVKLYQHLMQCALVQPHVSVTTSRYSPHEPPRSLWINEYDYGRSILTTDQDGSDDVWARYAMCSSDGRMVLSAADASAWDQNVKSVFLQAYYEGIKQAIDERAIMDGGYYMYKGGIGLSLSQVCDEFMNMQAMSMYIADYGWEAAMVKVNFLTSGRLDTFMFNSIMNSEINAMINAKLKKLPTPAVYATLTVAGDDMLSVLNTTASKADEIESMKETVVTTYNNVGHKMNYKKTVIARHQSEVAKRNFYFGHTFRDPNVQFYESEKDDNAENRLTRIRGQASKQFEALRRSVSDIELSAMMMRLGVMLMYSFKYLPPKKPRNLTKKGKAGFEDLVSVKYYPPYALSIIPTHVSGGVGMTFTGVSINEAKFIIDENMSLVDRALPVARLIKNTSIQGVQNAFVKHFISPDKYGIIMGSENKSVELVGEPIFKNVNPTDTKPSIQAGMSLTQKSLKVENVNASVNAINKLAQAGVTVQESVKYKNAPELLIRNMAESISLRYNRGRKDVDEVIRSLFFVDNYGKIQMKAIKQGITMRTMYPVYTMFTCRTVKDSLAPGKISNGIARIISQPQRLADMEIYYGARHGKNARLNLQGANTLLRKFITRSGLSMTAEQLMENMTASGVLNDESRLRENLTNYLIAVSGDKEASERYVMESTKDMYVWEHMLTAITIAGSMVEAFDWSAVTVNHKSKIRSDHLVPPNVANMILYTNYMYMLQKSCFYNEFYDRSEAHMNMGYELILRKMRPKGTRKSVKTALDNDVINTMADFYDRNKTALESYFTMIKDENFE